MINNLLFERLSFLLNYLYLYSKFCKNTSSSHHLVITAPQPGKIASLLPSPASHETTPIFMSFSICKLTSLSPMSTG